MRLLRGFRRRSPAGERDGERPGQAPGIDSTPVDIAPDDPLIDHFQSASGAVDIEALDVESPAKRQLIDAGVKLAVPLISQGELIGLLNLGPRRSERDYSGDDRKLLDNLAAHAAPAVRVAQLVRQQEAEVRSRERLEQELKVAQLIQQQFLPKELPNLPGWEVAAYYRPARAVGGDFYDFIELPDGRVGLIVGDVTDKGVPAALVMATTHSILRADAPRLVSPGKVLARTNDLLFTDIPSNMFVTCMYAVLDPASGKLQFANAGHNLPYVRTPTGVQELRATGMPLGLMPGMTYEENETILEPGADVLFHSDGLVEAHAPDRQMFGFDRLAGLVRDHPGGTHLIDILLDELHEFAGQGWEQEDDITLVTLQRSGGPRAEDRPAPKAKVAAADVDHQGVVGDEELLTEFTLKSEPGNERIAMDRVAELAQPLLPERELERLKTAVAEATMNAIEHGNHNDPELSVSISVATTPADLKVRITDHGGGQPIPEMITPDIEAKLSGEQTARGWGLFLIKNMVDEMNISSDGEKHTIELVLHRAEGREGSA